VKTDSFVSALHKIDNEIPHNTNIYDKENWQHCRSIVPDKYGKHSAKTKERE